MHAEIEIENIRVLIKVNQPMNLISTVFYNPRNKIDFAIFLNR